MASLPEADARSRRRTAAPTPLVWALLGWAICSIIMLWLFRDSLATLAFRDPDDAMRLAQVRDWIGGQGFYDVSQHRVNPPMGGPMHWSRIVDMPIAALILLARPLVGHGAAEALALALVPLLLLGALVAAVYCAAARIGGVRIALLACALLLTAPSILVQFTPLRIDHHGWQILLAAIALAGLLDPRPWRGGMTAGLALALWLQISIEGLPLAALAAGVCALRQWIAKEEAPRFIGLAAMLGGAAFLLLLLLRGWPAPLWQQCDALSAPFTGPLLGFAVATALAARLLGSASAARRFGIAAIGGGTALALFAGLGGSCLSGDPFATLGPLAYRIWYLEVMEGRPIWEQPLSVAGIILLPALVGLAGALAAARTTRGPARLRWLMLALLVGGATLIACLVMRALSVAHMLALPGIAWAIASLMARTGGAGRPLTRVAGSAALVLLTPVGLNMLWLMVAAAPVTGNPKSGGCRTPAALAPLAQLPPSVLLAPLDLGPDILIRSGHSVIGTAHHRNAAGITAVIEAFTAPPDQARAIIGRLNGGRGVDYVVSCADLNEMLTYDRENRQGLAATLSAGRTPDWLTPVRTTGPIAIYRVAGVKDRATPFMQ